MGDYAEDEYYSHGGRDDDLIADPVQDFVRRLNQRLGSRDTYEIHNLYEDTFHKLTDKLFKASPWPTAEAVAFLVDNDENFLCMYRELYFRHVHSKMAPRVDDRFDSFQNYIDLFNIILGLKDDAPELEIPWQWLWDIVDEFVDQFQSFHEFRTNFKEQRHDEVQLLVDNPHAWSAQTVIRYLHALVKKGGVSLEEEQYESKNNGIAEMFQTLAQFSIIGLARVNCIIGDYVSCLEVLRPINLDQDQKMNPYKRVIPAHITLQYYMSFAYMMLRRYDDTTRTLAPFLLYISRNQNLLPRSYIQQVASKKVDLVDMMYGILAITSTISPQTLDDSLISGMNEKFEKMEDRLQGMQEWDETCFEDMFADSCPKFIVPCIPNYDNPSSINEAFSLQIRIFLREIQQRASLSEISSHLKLCASVNKEKLARFLKTDDTTLGTTLLNLKHKNRSLRWEGGAPSDGKWITSSQVEFFVTKNMVHVSENKTPARHGDYFIRNILKFEDMVEDMRSRKR